MESGDAYLLNRDLRQKGITSIHAFPVDYPRRTRSTPGVPMILIATRTRNEHLIRLAECKPFVEDSEDLRAKKWLEINGVMNPSFVAVPDPLGKYDEYGTDYD
jgi:hypothetical protein